MKSDVPFITNLVSMYFVFVSLTFLRYIKNMKEKCQISKTFICDIKNKVFLPK